MTVKLFPVIRLGGTNVITGVLYDEGERRAFAVLTGSYFLCFSGTVGGVQYGSLYSAIAEQLTLTSDAVAAFYEYHLDFNAEQDRLVITKTYDLSPAPEIQITASNAFTQGILGGASSVLVSETDSMTGSYQPSHCWVSSREQLGKPTDLIEPGPFYYDHIADDGTCYSIGKVGTEKHQSWLITTEPKANIISGLKGNDTSWSFQDFQAHVRTTLPFGMVTASVGNVSGSDVINVYRLRAEGSNFKPKFTMANFDSYRDHDLMVRWVSSSI